MASKSEEVLMNPFQLAENKIRNASDEMIKVIIKRRDQLLLQLFDISQEYIHEETTRKKQVNDLEKLISQLNDTTLQQNEILKYQKEQIQHTTDELQKYQQPTPVPFLSVDTDGLDSLLIQLETFGSVVDLARPYKNKIQPVKRFHSTEKNQLFHGIGLNGEKIYTSDWKNNSVYVFSMKGKLLEKFSDLSFPHSFAFYDKWVFISDWMMYSVSKLWLSNFKLICKSVKEELNLPQGITADTTGEILVADLDHNRIAVLSSTDLKCIRELGKGKIHNPLDVKVNNDKIIVLDHSPTDNIHILSKSGNLLTSFVKSRGSSICIDKYNNFIVSEDYSHCIRIYSSEGVQIHEIHCDEPGRIAITCMFDIICTNQGSVCIY